AMMRRISIMMKQKSQIKQISILITLIYLFLSGFIMIGVGGHAAEHGHSADHATQHASFVCTWMCAASSFVHSADQKPSYRFNPCFENLQVYPERVSSNISIFSFYIRPPPFFLS
ncbi:MAG: hypothetical protein AAB014_03270, partial [Nitrospirota bacterium]